jgi:hypothetical protein
MQIELCESGSRLVVRFEQADALDALLAKARSEPPILRLDTRLDEGAALLLELADGVRRVELPAKVKQVFRSGADRFGTVLEIDLCAGRELGAEAPAEIAASEPESELEGLGLAEADAEAAPDASDDAGAGGETLGSSVAFELQRMRPDERVRVAAKASRAQRQILLRDRTPQVLLALLGNPWIENAEVLEIARNPKVVGPVLQRLADDRRFGPNAQVQAALARNPSTPSTVTARLLPLLPTRELRELARSTQVREALRKAALKLYLERM